MQVARSMPEKDIQTLRDIVAPIVKGVWALAALGFAGGVWATTLQNKVENLEQWTVERKKGIEEYELFRRDQSDRLARIEEKLDNVIKRTEK